MLVIATLVGLFGCTEQKQASEEHGQQAGASGPPPGVALGGIVGLDRGTHGYFTAYFDAGRYALICFLPDAATGQPHFMKGMTAEFTVE
ncbi:MAG TPA: hypothetical protein VFA38_06180 [Nitrospirales bacterium]|nr:hypothetical protein [Nitrospirales bacterium]